MHLAPLLSVSVMTREEGLERFAPRPKWRLERIVHHELTPDHPPPVRLTFYQRAANNRWSLCRAQQLVSHRRRLILISPVNGSPGANDSVVIVRVSPRNVARKTHSLPKSLSGQAPISFPIDLAMAENT